jgi:transcription initiation factor TFIIB
MSMELGIYNDNFGEQDNQNNQSQNNDKSQTSFFLSNYQLIKTNDKTSITKPKYMAKGISNFLSIDQYIAIDLAHKTSKNLLVDGKSPNGIAAAYIYLSSVLLGMNILQIDVSGLAGVTEVTIRNRCKEILCSSKIIITIRPTLK